VAEPWRCFAAAVVFYALAYGLAYAASKFFLRNSTATIVPGALIGLAAIVIAAVTSAVRTLERAPFWAGSVLGVATILSRFVEFETELWLKAIVFLACGVAVIRFGVVFERKRRVVREAAHA